MKLDLQLFASSGSVDTTIAYSSYGNSWGTTSWTQTSNNNGTSTVNYSVVFHITTSNYRYVWFNSYVTAYANGSQVDRKSIDSGYISCGNNTIIFSGSFTITDGASIRFVTDLRIGDSQVGYTSDQTWTSDTYVNDINVLQVRKEISLDSSYKTITVNINEKNPNATNLLVIDYGDSSTITRNNVHNGDTITFTDYEIGAMLLANTGRTITGTVTLRTIVGGTVIGSTNTPIWWYPHQDSTTKPTITNATITVTEDNSTVASLTNSEKYIRGYSRQNVSITATFTGQYGATITEVYTNGVLMTGSGNTYQVTLPESEVSNFIGITAIDTRGFVSEASSINTYVVDYTPPVLSNVVLERRDGVSEEVELNLTLKLWNGNYRQGDLSTYDNTVYSFKYLVKEHSASTYGNPIDNTTRFKTAISGQSIDNIVLSGFRVYSDDNDSDFDFGTAYDMLVEVFDGLETTRFNSSGLVLGVVDDGLVLDSYSKSSTGYKYAINGIVDDTLEDGLQVNGKFYLNGINLLEILHPIGEVYTTTDSSFDPNISWGGTWEQLTADAYFKIVTSGAGNLNGTSSTHQIPVSSMPAHAHLVTTPVYYYSERADDGGIYGTMASTTKAISRYTDGAGGGQAYYPYYYGVIAWHRTA